MYIFRSVQQHFPNNHLRNIKTISVFFQLKVSQRLKSGKTEEARTTVLQTLKQKSPYRKEIMMKKCPRRRQDKTLKKQLNKEEIGNFPGKQSE